MTFLIKFTSIIIKKLMRTKFITFWSDPCSEETISVLIRSSCQTMIFPPHVHQTQCATKLQYLVFCRQNYSEFLVYQIKAIYPKVRSIHGAAVTYVNPCYVSRITQALNLEFSFLNRISLLLKSIKPSIVLMWLHTFIIRTFQQ